MHAVSTFRFVLLALRNTPSQGLTSVHQICLEIAAGEAAHSCSLCLYAGIFRSPGQCKMLNSYLEATAQVAVATCGESYRSIRHSTRNLLVRSIVINGQHNWSNTGHLVWITWLGDMDTSSGYKIWSTILHARTAFRHTWLYLIPLLWITRQNHSSSPATSELLPRNSFCSFWHSYLRMSCSLKLLFL